MDDLYFLGDAMTKSGGISHVFFIVLVMLIIFFLLSDKVQVG